MLTYEKGLLPYKQDLLTYPKKNSLTHTKSPWQILTANSYGKFLRQISTSNSCGKFSRQIATPNACSKFPRQIPAANSHGKFLRQILAANSHGKFLRQIHMATSCGKFPRQIATANSCGKFPRQILKYAIQKIVWSNPQRGRASHMKIKRKQLTKQKLRGLISLISKTYISNISEISCR